MSTLHNRAKVIKKVGKELVKMNSISISMANLNKETHTHAILHLLTCDEKRTQQARTKQLSVKVKFKKNASLRLISGLIDKGNLTD